MPSVQYLFINTSHLDKLPRVAKDLFLFLSFVALGFFSQNSGNVEKSYAIFYIMLVVLLRIRLKMPLTAGAFIFHLAITHSLIANIDKIKGYPDDSHFVLTLIMYLSWVLLFVLSWHIAIIQQTWIPIVALIFLIFPLAVLPLEIGRNMIARAMFENIPNIYVTKIDSPHIYGVNVTHGFVVCRYTFTDGEYLQDVNTDIQGLGSGSIDPQFANLRFPSLNLIKYMYGK